MLFLVLAILVAGSAVSGLILLSSRRKVDGIPRDLRRAGDEEPTTPGTTFRRAFGRSAWQMHSQG
ncbi:hypothetical protein [Dactylosporangium sp. NPDC005555]|uniref:hypothetical protein n=1 Tax=Dactylosporangium sp. NPDC005555 TaxID=3154889 RepID=UPI0033AB4AD9